MISIGHRRRCHLLVQNECREAIDEVDVVLLLGRDCLWMFSDDSQRRGAREIEIDECDAVDQTDWVAVMWFWIDVRDDVL